MIVAAIFIRHLSLIDPTVIKANQSKRQGQTALHYSNFRANSKY